MRAACTPPQRCASAARAGARPARRRTPRGVAPALLTAACGGDPAGPECATSHRLCVAPAALVLAQGETRELVLTTARGERLLEVYFVDNGMPQIAVDPARGRVTGREAGQAHVSVRAKLASGESLQEVPVTVRGITGIRETVHLYTYTYAGHAPLPHYLGEPTVVGGPPGDHRVRWASSDTTVFTVSADGVLTGRRVGTAQLTGTAVADPTIRSFAPVEVHLCGSWSSRVPCVDP